MIIPIPIGVQHKSTVRGSVWKVVSCACCRERFAFRLELEAEGSDLDLLYIDAKGSQELAESRAQANFLQQVRNSLLAIPCPNCGVFQEEMVALLKERASINSWQIAGLLLIVSSFFALKLEMDDAWKLTLGGVLVGLGLLGLGYVVAFRFNPNSGDAEARRVAGQRDALWGEALEDLLKDVPTITHSVSSTTVVAVS
jgi:hypothetical protein